MPGFFLNTVSGLSRVLNGGDLGRIDPGGLLFSSGANIPLLMNGGAFLLNYGSVFASQTDAIRVSGQGASILNVGTIRTSGPGASGIEYAGSAPTSNLLIENYGLIRASAPSGLAIEARTGGGTIINAGTILSEGRTAIVVRDDNGGSQGVRITNSGTIRASLDDGPGNADAIVITNNDRDVIENTGQILGDVFTGGGDDLIVNLGLIQGFVNTGAGNDLVINSGVLGQTGPGSGSTFIMELGDGNDTLDAFDATGFTAVAGGNGDDLYLVGNADTLIVERAGGGNDTVRTSVDFDIGFDEIETLILQGGALVGTGGNTANKITGNDNDNTLIGKDGNDTLSGGVGADSLFGGEDDDLLLGGSEGDQLTGDAGNDFLAGDGGTDSLFGGGDDDDMFGGTGNDQLAGGTGNDTLRGSEDNDTLSGDAGGDVLRGDAGADVLAGGSEADVFEFRSLGDSGITSTTRDVITDFQTGVDDLLFTGLGLSVAPRSGGGIGGDFTGGAGQLIFRTVAGNGFVEVDANGDRVADFSVQLTGVTALSLADLLL